MPTILAPQSSTSAIGGRLAFVAVPRRSRAGEGLSLLSYSTPFERALELSVERAFSVETPVRDVINPEAAAPGLLPWIAFAVSVDNWRPDWTDAQKRAAIGVSIYVKRHKGTIGAVRAAVGAVMDGAVVREFGPAKPFRGEVLLNVHSADFNENTVDEMVRVVDSSKNLRTQMDLRLFFAGTAPVGVGAAMHVIEVLSVRPAP